MLERRVKKLEKLVAQQGYIIWILLILYPLLAGAVLLLWQGGQKPDFDHIAVSLTVFQMMFAIAALYGFWALRSAAKEKAEDVAEAEVQKIAPPIIRRITLDTLETFRPAGTISEPDVDGIVDAIGGKEDGNGE